MLKVAFHSGYLGFRGTEVALIDYAWGNQNILGNESFFLLPWREKAEKHPVVQIMEKICPTRFYRTADERESILKEEKANFFYCIKNGNNDGVFSKKVLTGVHAIFQESEFHGDIYAFISPWLARVTSYGRSPVVPCMVRLPEIAEDLKEELGIPAGAFVFGRHGGEDSFDIRWAQRAVVRAAGENHQIWFLFLNTREFAEARPFGNIRFLPATSDPRRKKAFLNTCDVMIHARQRGETLGMACLEFAMAGKPVITYAHSPEKAHLEILGKMAIPYRNAEELVQIIQKFSGNKKISAQPDPLAKRIPELDDFYPSEVMSRFHQVFLQGV